MIDLTRSFLTFDFFIYYAYFLTSCNQNTKIVTLEQTTSCGFWVLHVENWRACSVYVSISPAASLRMQTAPSRWSQLKFLHISCRDAACITTKPPAELLVWRVGLPLPNQLYYQRAWCRCPVPPSLVVTTASIWHCWRSCDWWRRRQWGSREPCGNEPPW